MCVKIYVCEKNVKTYAPPREVQYFEQELALIVLLSKLNSY